MFGLEAMGVEFLAGAWDIGTFLGSAATTLEKWFNAGLLIVGLVAIAFASWQIVSGLMSHGKKPVNWGVAIILLLVGGVLASSGGGFDFMADIASGGTKTVKDLGGGTIFLMDYGRMMLGR